MKFKTPTDHSQSSKNFLKLKKNGDAIIGVFAGEPYDFKQHWIENRAQLCPGAGCTICSEGKKPGFRFRLNFITKDNEGKYIALIFEQGWTVYQTLAALHGNDYDLENTIVKITRNGEGQKTTYSIIPIPNHQVTPDLKAALSRVKLNDLINLADEKSELEEMSDIPF